MTACPKRTVKHLQTVGPAAYSLLMRPTTHCYSTGICFEPGLMISAGFSKIPVAGLSSPSKMCLPHVPSGRRQTGIARRQFNPLRFTGEAKLAGLNSNERTYLEGWTWTLIIQARAYEVIQTLFDIIIKWPRTRIETGIIYCSCARTVVPFIYGTRLWI
jgi:hypothetical protein